MRIQVVVAVIQDPKRGVLISKRQGDQHLAGLWEFPGGKVDVGEAPAAALERELKEELGVELSESDYLFSIKHDYPEKSVELLIYKVSLRKSYVTKFDCDDALGEEGQAVLWVPLNELKAYEFPPANVEIVNALMGGL